MKLGLQINRFDFNPDTKSIHTDLAAIAKAAEDADFDSLWLMDHFFQLPMLGPETDPMMEAYTTLGYLAGITKKVMLGTLVTGVIYREPALLIKAVTALDVVSGGRAYFGVGAGWYEQEAAALGFMNPLKSNRFDRLEEVLQLTQQMWKDDSAAFEGKYYQLPKPINHPQPVAMPHPPIMVGGSGEQKTLRLVAQYADACNLFASGNLSDLKHKLEVLEQHCQEVGRDYNEIEKTALAAGMNINVVASKPAETRKLVHELHELGVEHVIFGVAKDIDLAAYHSLKGLAAEIHNL